MIECSNAIARPCGQMMVLLLDTQESNETRKSLVPRKCIQHPEPSVLHISPRGSQPSLATTENFPALAKLSLVAETSSPDSGKNVAAFAGQCIGKTTGSPTSPAHCAQSVTSPFHRALSSFAWFILCKASRLGDCSLMFAFLCRLWCSSFTIDHFLSFSFVSGDSGGSTTC